MFGTKNSVTPAGVYGDNIGSILADTNLAPGYTAIVTGAHQGLGYEVSKYLAFLGARVVLACDKETKARAAMLRIQADVMEMHSSKLAPKKEAVSENETNPDLPLQLDYIALDLASLASVAQFVKVFKKECHQLHLLFCNDAVVHVPKVTTVDGNELHFQFNYLSHMLLTMLLTPVMLRNSGYSKIMLASNLCHTKGNVDLRNMQGTVKNTYDPANFFANSQLYMIMLMYSLERRLATTNIRVFCIHNGTVDMTMKKSPDYRAYWDAVFYKMLMNSQKLHKAKSGGDFAWIQGGVIDTLLEKQQNHMSLWEHFYTAECTVGKISSDMAKTVASAFTSALGKVSQNGCFVVDGETRPTSKISNDKKLQEIVWRYSVSLIKDHLTLNEEESSHFTLTDKQLEKIGIVTKAYS